jgi:acyl-CoA synthetase (AMP-forming)/AMP-acid ligase II
MDMATAQDEAPRVYPLPFAATMPALLERAAEQFGDREFIVTPNASYTYAEIEAASRVVARRLAAAGVGKATRLGMLFAQTPEWVITFFAAARIGALVMTFSSFYKPAELAKAMRHGDISHLVVPQEMFGRSMTDFVTEAVPGVADSGPRLRLPDFPFLRSVLVYGEGETPKWASSVHPADTGADLVDEAMLTAMQDAITPADLLVTIYTSGTTSAPKGVVHTHGAQVRHSGQLAKITRLSPEDRVFAGMPFFWVGGLTTTLLPAVHIGGVVLAQERFRAGEALDLLEGGRATRIIAWPTLRQRLQTDPTFPQRDLSRVAAFPQTDGVRHGSLGMTETSGPHTYPGPNELGQLVPPELHGSVGRSVSYVEHRIADPVTNETLPDDEVGEICVRGYSVMNSIYKQEREKTFDVDGWYHTGDHGYFHDGLIIFDGRASEMIKTGGSNVAPLEVEAEIEALPEVISAWVFGLPDEDRGQKVVAAVLPLEEADVDGIKATLAARLSSYKVPREIISLTAAEVPLLATGKADKRAVEAIVRQRLS